MSRRPPVRVGPTSTTSGTINQENNACRPKVSEATNDARTRITGKPALRDIKNQPGQMGPKRAVSLKDGKCDETNGVAMKAETRRPLRATASSSNVCLAAGRNVDQKRVVKNMTFQSGASANTSELSVSTNSTMNCTAAADVTKKTKPSTTSSFATSRLNAPAAAVNGKPRLTRNNAASSLNQLKEKSSVPANETSKTETKELSTMQATATILAPVEEENENVISKSPERDNAYSSSIIPNIDVGDEDNPQMASAYVNEIFAYLRKLEQNHIIRENFLDGKEVNGRMRSILIDWLSQVHIRFHLIPETLYMTVSLIDRFLQEHSVPKEKLQLVGVTALFVASKYEEMYAPEIADFSYITDHSCSKEDIRAMECLLLRTLGFNLGRPLPIHFLRRYSKAINADATKHTMAKYFLELSLIHYSLSHFPPSLMAAAAFWLAMKLLDPHFQWSPMLIHYTKYKEPDFQPCLQRLCRAVVKTHLYEIKQQAIRNKFGTSKFMEISKHPCLDLEAIRKYGDC